MRGRDPVQGAFHLAAVRRVTAAGIRVIRAAQFDNLSGIVLDHLRTSDEVGVTKADLFVGRQAKELLRRFFHEIIPFDVDLTGKGYGSGAGVRILGIVDRFQFFGLSLRIVFDDDLQWVEHAHAA